MQTTKPQQFKLTYKKVIGFTETQHKTLLKLENLNINVNRFIRDAVKEKIQRDMPEIKERINLKKCPF